MCFSHFRCLLISVKPLTIENSNIELHWKLSCFSHSRCLLISEKPLTTENKTTPKICKITVPPNHSPSSSLVVTMCRWHWSVDDVTFAPGAIGARAGCPRRHNNPRMASEKLEHAWPVSLTNAKPWTDRWPLLLEPSLLWPSFFVKKLCIARWGSRKKLCDPGHYLGMNYSRSLSSLQWVRQQDSRPEFAHLALIE